MTNNKANIDFPIRLLNLLSEKDNSVISPYGIAAVLSMAAEGASEKSLDEILACLGFDSLDKLRATVLDMIAAPCDAFESENAITLGQGTDNTKLLEPFKQTMGERYSAAVDEKMSDGEPYVGLQNITSFKAEWLYKMKRDAIQGNCFFQNADGSYSQPVFLNCTEQLYYYKDKDIETTVQAVALPYKLNSDQIPFELVLVDSEKPLSEALLGEILANMREGKCEVEFPEFSIDSEFDLIPMMKSLGLQNIFDKEAAALDRIATTPLWAEAFRQKAEIQVDKHGTVARAFTFTFACMSCIPKAKFTKPFHYFLRNTNTGTILFMGRINKLADCDHKATNDISDMLAFK